MKHSPFIVLLAVLLMVACKPTIPSEYIQPGELEDLLYDYHVAEALARTQHGGAEMDVERTVYFDAVLKRHGVTQADFDSTLVYYYSNVDLLQEIYVRVNDRLAKEAKRLGTEVGDIHHYSQYGESGDTANIWTRQTDVLLIPKPTMNRYDFVVKADSTFLVGDSFMFQFMSEYIWQSGSKDIVVCISSQYDNDSIAQQVIHTSSDGITQLRVPASRTQLVKEMRGYIYVTDSPDARDEHRLMFVSQMQLIRFRDQEMKKPHEAEPTDSTTVSVERIGNP